MARVALETCYWQSHVLPSGQGLVTQPNVPVRLLALYPWQTRQTALEPLGAPARARTSNGMEAARHLWTANETQPGRVLVVKDLASCRGHLCLTHSIAWERAIGLQRPRAVEWNA